MQKQREMTTMETKWKQADLETSNVCSIKKERHEIRAIQDSDYAVAARVRMFHLIHMSQVQMSESGSRCQRACTFVLIDRPDLSICCNPY